MCISSLWRDWRGKRPKMNLRRKFFFRFSLLRISNSRVLSGGFLLSQKTNIADCVSPQEQQRYTIEMALISNGFESTQHWKKKTINPFKLFLFSIRKWLANRQRYWCAGCAGWDVYISVLSRPSAHQQRNGRSSWCAGSNSTPLRYGCAFFLFFFLNFSFLYFILLNSLKYWQTNLGAQDAYQYTDCVCVFLRTPIIGIQWWKKRRKKKFPFLFFVFVQRAW
jgi:hypothetical protein